MRNNIIDIMRKNKLFIIPIGVVLVMFTAYMIINHQGILIFNGDSYETMYQFYVGGYEKFHSGTLFSFDFSMGLGSNPLYNTFYFLLSPFFYLTCLLPKHLIDESFLWMSILKLVILYYCSLKWLKKISNNDIFILCAAMMFTFSGWTFFYSHYVFFLDHIFVLPLLLYYTECYINDGKYKGLVITIAYIALVNYYFAYLFIPFVCIYALYRSLVLSWKVKEILKKGVKFVLYILLGLGIGSIIFVPNIITVLSNPRLVVDKDLAIMDKYEIFKFVSSFFTPVISRLNANLFISDKWYGFMGWGNGASLYMGSLTILTTSYFLFLKNSREKLLLVILSVFTFILFLFPSFSYLLQGTMDTRWYFYFSIVFILMMKMVFDDLSQTRSNRTMVISLFTIVVTIMILLASSYYFKLNDNESLYQLFYIEIVVLLLVICYGMFIKKNYKLLIIVVIVDVTFSGYTYIRHNTPLDSTSFLNEHTDNTVFSELDDGSFYRINQDGYAYWPSNNTFAKNINGLTFYNSIYNYEMEEYLNRYKSAWSMPARGGQDIAHNLLSVKYWVTKTHGFEPPFGYEIVDEKDGLSVYGNKQYIELGFGYDKTINKKAIEHLSFLEQDLIMQEYLVTEDSLNFEYNINGVLEKIGEFTIEGEEIIKDSIWGSVLLFENENRNDVTIELYYNGMFLKSYNFYDQPYFSIPLHEHLYVGEVKIINRSQTPIDITYYHLNPGYFRELYNERINNAFKDSVMDKNYIKANISIGEDMYIFTSIPFDIGWDVYVNDKKTEYQKVQMGFIGFELKKGNYEVEFYYSIPNLKGGILISCFSIVVFMVVFYKEKRR